MGSTMSAKKAPSNGVKKLQQQSPAVGNQQQDAAIIEKTLEAIATQEALPSKSNESAPSKPARDDRKRARAMCRMFFPSSGRMGFGKVTDSDEFPPLEAIRQMITYETRLRLSDSIQELMDVHHADEESVT